MEKRHAGRFCIQFNTADTRHAQVVELLETQGRRKAQFIAEAVLHYINCGESSEIQVRLEFAISKEQIEAIVLEILRQRELASGNDEQPLDNVPMPSVKVQPSPFDFSDETDAVLMASIRESISALREQG